MRPNMCELSFSRMYRGLTSDQMWASWKKLTKGLLAVWIESPSYVAEPRKCCRCPGGSEGQGDTDSDVAYLLRDVIPRKIVIAPAGMLSFKVVLVPRKTKQSSPLFPGRTGQRSVQVPAVRANVTDRHHRQDSSLAEFQEPLSLRRGAA